MNFLVFIMVFLGSMPVTSYRSIPAQTKPHGYYWTASGDRVNSHGCAVSRDLLQQNGGRLQFGDLLYIEKIGYKFVNDTMNRRHKQRIDIWVPTYRDEKKFDEKFRGKKLKVWIVYPLFKEK